MPETYQRLHALIIGSGVVSMMQRFCSVSVLLFLLSTGLMGCDDGSAKNAVPKSTLVQPGPVDPDAPEEFTTTESGLKYRIRRKSDGKKPTAKSMVTAHYRGWLEADEIFDTSYGTGGVARTFAMTGVIPGWTEGLQLIGEGGMIELEVPSELGYGRFGQPTAIPGNATLHFLVEVIKVGEDVVPPAKPEEGPDPSGSMPPGAEPGKVDTDAPMEFTTTASGLKYRVRRKSEGRKPAASNTVKVHYRGWLDNGTVFDESYRAGTPVEFSLGGVIAGWTEGLQLVGEGGMIELEIPSNLGYGARGQPPQIPPNATLHFTVELLSVK